MIFLACGHSKKVRQAIVNDCSMTVENMVVIKIVRYAVLLAFIIGGMAFVHFWTVDQKGVLRQLYPFPAMLSHWSVSCSRNAPEWLNEIANRGIDELKALASQVGYIDSEGNLHHCESGWQGRAFLSPRITESSRFLYGSLTKPITSAAVLTLIDEGVIDYSTSILTYFLGSDVNALNNNEISLSVKNLLSHRAGVFGEVFSNKEKPWCPYDLTELTRQKYWVLNDNEHRYSNLSYCLLGELVARSYDTNYRSAVINLFDLGSLNIEFVDSALNDDFVSPDYRYHDFYRADVLPSFDYFAVSSTAGMVGSATSYARLMHKIIGQNLPGFIQPDHPGCDSSKIRTCYGNAFYQYRSINGVESEMVHLKEGYMPGFSGLVAVNNKNEIFVWLGNSDTPNAKSGHAMKTFIDQLMLRGF